MVLLFIYMQTSEVLIDYPLREKPKERPYLDLKIESDCTSPTQTPLSGKRLNEMSFAFLSKYI